MQHQPDEIVLFFGNLGAGSRTAKHIVKQLGKGEMEPGPLEDVRDSALILTQKEGFQNAEYNYYQDTIDGGMTYWLWLGNNLSVDPNSEIIQVK
jgi:hypothetical protein